MTATIAGVQAGIKTFYPQSKIDEALLKRNTFYGIVKKNTKWEGSPMHIAITLAPTSGGSRTFSTAQARQGASVIRNFAITHADDYSTFRLQRSLVKATGSNKGALMSMIKAQGDSALNNLERSIGFSMFGNLGGARGQIASGADTDTLVLSDIRQATNFEQGMWLVSDDTDGTAGGTASANAVQIIGINYNTGALTAAAAWHADFDTNDYLFRDGDFGLAFSGLPAWLPATAPGGSDSFFGFNRSTNSRSYGVIFDADAQEHGTISEYLIDFAAELGRLGSTPDTVILNPRRFGQLQRELNEKVIYDKISAQGADGEVDFSFKSIQLMSGYGPIQIVQDMNCPYDRCYMLQLDTWTFWSMDEIGWMESDADKGTGKFLTAYNADAWEARLGGYMQLVCTIPGYNGTGSIAALGV